MEKITIKNNILKLALAIGIFSLVFFAFNNIVRAESFSCSGTLTHSQFRQAQSLGLVSANVYVQGETGKAVITNNTDCILPVSLVSFEMYDQTLEGQRYFAGVNGSVAPHSNLNLSVALPDCMAQIDAYYGSIRYTPVGDAEYGIGFSFYQNDTDWQTYGGDYGWQHATGNFCGNTPPAPSLTLINPTPACNATSVTLTWTSNDPAIRVWAWDQNAPAVFLSGLDGRVQNGTSVNLAVIPGHRYNWSAAIAGLNRTSTPFNVSICQSNLQVSCSASPSSVQVGGIINWISSALGGTGLYTYSWSGTDSLSGSASSVSKSYSSVGTKNATVTVTSGSDTASADCSAQVTSAPVALTVSCLASPSSVQVGGTINWSSSVSGGTGTYTYSWSGTDSLSGSASSVSKSYSSIGTKNATVTVTSGSDTASADCSAYVSSNPSPSLSVSCYPSTGSVKVGDTMSWYANASGGTGSYTYSWSGDEGLSGNSNSRSMVYYYTGSKTANVTVTSGSRSGSATCYTNVYQENNYCTGNCGYYDYNYLEGSCSANISNTNVGTIVNWSASASNGNGFYTYSWDGTDGLSSISQYVSKIYSTPGVKTATVTIYSNSQRITRTCSVNINQVLGYSESKPNLSSIYLSEIPYTGAGDNLKIALFGTALALWSALVAYVIGKRRQKNEISFSTAVAKKTEASVVADNSSKVMNLVSDDENDIVSVENYARINKVIISKDAVTQIVKLSRLGKINASELIRNIAESKIKNQEEWVTLGEKDIEKYL